MKSQFVICAALCVLVAGCVEAESGPNNRGLRPFDTGGGVQTSDLGMTQVPDDMAPSVDAQGEDVGTSLEDVGGGLPDQARVDMPNNGFCMPNNDGTITRQEVPLRAGLSATYKVALDVDPVDVTGEDGAEQGQKVWDYSGDFSGDMRTIVEALDPKGRWYSADFPEASYVARLSASSDLLGVFQITPDALLLLGVVSPGDNAFTKTNIKHTPPVEVLSFPIQENSTWSTSASVRGTASGLFFSSTEEYTSQVDGRGVVKTPYGDLPVYRVRTELKRTIGFLTTTIRTYLFVSECFGTVATIVSEDNESEVEFTKASEVRRLAP